MAWGGRRLVVADTGAIIALIDADDRYHDAILSLYSESSSSWILPWMILPEVDYLLARHVGEGAADAFRADLAGGAFAVEWGNEADIQRAHELCLTYKDLRLGLVDAVVAATAERLRAGAIATLDLRDFGALELKGSPRLIPRDA